MIHHVELVARIVAFARLGDPNAISVNGKARWTWCIEDAEKFLRLYPEILAQLTKTPSADHDDCQQLSQADVCDAGVKQTWDECPECGASSNDLCGKVFSLVVAETDANAPGNTDLVSGVSSAPNHQPHAVSQGWRDIETAPMDGSRVLLFTDELTPPTIQAQWRPYETFFAGAGEWVDVWNNDPIETNKGPIRPTNWMPLPAPPSPAKTGGVEG